MKTNHQNKTLTFGDLIANVYDICGQQRAQKIIQSAVNERIIVFRGHRHIVVIDSPPRLSRFSNN